MVLLFLARIFANDSFAKLSEISHKSMLSSSCWDLVGPQTAHKHIYQQWFLNQLVCPRRESGPSIRKWRVADTLGPLELPTYPPFVLRTQFCLSSMSRTGEVAGPSKSKQSPFPLPVTTLKGKVSRKALYFFPTTLAVVLFHAFTTGWLGFVLLSAMAAMSQLRGPKLEGKTQTHRACQDRNVIKSNKCPYSVSPRKPSICYLELKL